jgi:hypothetical protein
MICFQSSELGNLEIKNLPEHGDIVLPVAYHQQVVVGGEPIQMQVKTLITTLDKVERDQTCFHVVTSQ